jgi:glycogen operon protein
MVSQGVPMILAGDEFGRTQYGNNNAYCQDTTVSWMDWSLAEKHHGLLRFFRKIIALRQRHPVFRRAHFLTGQGIQGDQMPDISWHGFEYDKPDWSENAHSIAFMLNGNAIISDSNAGDIQNYEEKDHSFFVVLNGDQKQQSFALPPKPEGMAWFRIVDTGKVSPEDILDEDVADPVPHEKYALLPSAVAVFMARQDHEEPY